MAILQGSVQAAEIRVLSTHTMQAVFEELGPQFEQATGHKLFISYDPAAVLKRRIEQGETFDVLIGVRRVVEDLAKKDAVRTDSIRDIGGNGLGVSVKKDAPKPDISTAETFRKCLLAAKSVVRSTDGVSGAYFEQLMVKFGIAEEMKAKTRLGPSGRVAELVARGEVEMAVQQISELVPVKGADFVGPLPAEIQLYTTYSAAIGTDATEPQAAVELVEFLASSKAAPVIRSKALTPAT